VTPVRIELTETLRIETDAAVLDGARLGGARARLVFALLVLERARLLTRDELAEAVWGDRLPPTWRPALRNVVSKVRSFLEEAGADAVLTSDAAGRYQLRFTHQEPEVDLETMTTAVQRARAALNEGDRPRAAELASTARDIARRDLLAGLEGSWIDEVRSAQREALGAALRLIAEAELRRDPANATAAARELIALHPIDEDGYRLLMQIQDVAGNRAAALTTYMSCRAALAEELGVDPSPRTQQLYLGILRSGELEQGLVRARTQFVDVDGSRIAYQATGSGDIDVVFAGGTFTHVDTIWHDAAPARFFSCFLPAARLVFFDRGGTGASDPIGEVDTIDIHLRHAEDLRRVLDAAEVGRAVVVASLDGGPDALRLAADHPRRVGTLVLVNTTARWTRDAGYEEGLADDAVDDIVERVASAWGTEMFAAQVYPALREDARFLAWYARLQRTVTNPRAAAAAMRRLATLDLRSVLPRIAAPTLVLHRRHHPVFPPSQGRYLARHIAGARFELLDGSEGLFGKDSEAIAQLILDFAQAIDWTSRVP
jgi:DNA-binding SARP family transcriptional activator/pimeloyl-ACP methyl ester carboxylesterase